MDVQEKLEELLNYHVGLKNFYEKNKKKNEIKRHTQFIIAVNQTRVEMKLLREQVDDLKTTIKMMGDESSE